MVQRLFSMVLAALAWSACGDGGGGQADDATGGDAPDVTAEDAGEEVAPDVETEAETDAAEEADEGAEVDAADEVEDAADAEAGAGPSLVVTYADPCPCVPAPCCPTVTFSFQAGDEAAWFLMCGDAVECVPPPVGWERQATDGTWERVTSPGVTATAGFQCAPESFTDPWMFSVPMPPSGTVRAVGLFDDECGSDPGTCATRCDAPYEVISNEIVVP